MGKSCREGTQRLPGSPSEMVPPCLPSTAEFQKREHRGYLGVNLKFMTSARTTVAESVTRQVCPRGGPWDRTWVGRARAVSGTHGSLYPKHRGWATPLEGEEQSRAVGKLGLALLPCDPCGPRFVPLCVGMVYAASRDSSRAP